MWRALVRLIDKLACRHSWRLEKTIESTWDGIVIGYKYIYICKYCGKIKIVKI